MPVVEESRAVRAGLTREAIIDAAALLFSTRGYRAVSLRDIAAEAGISHPALLKHFAGKEELLRRVLDRYEDANTSSGLGDISIGSTVELPFAAVAARNRALPGYLPLFASLIGEASAPAHPAHAALRERAARFRRVGADLIEEAQLEGLVDDARIPADESARLMAAWDGLQVLEQYLPDRVDVVDALRQHEALLAFAPSWRAPDDVPHGSASAPAPSLPRFVAPPQSPETGYRSGRERRQRILDGAMALFAREGYIDTSLRDIAARVGVTKSALYHHFPSKDALLLAVLEERDRRIDAVVAAAPDRTAAETLRSLADGAATNETEQPGLIEVYAAISGEAVPRDHPAHAYFERRFLLTLDGFTALFRSAAEAGDLPAHRDPAHEGAWLLALWDGLQYQWLYDHDSVDVAGQLRAHLEDVLPG